MPIDPFASHLPKWHPRRAFLKAFTMTRERLSSRRFERCALPLAPLDELPPLPEASIAWDETAVTREQMRYLLAGLAETERFDDTTVVEVGAYRGVTTELLAQETDRLVVAVDAYHPGWAEADAALQAFRARTAKCRNVVLERRSSGGAAADWKHRQAGFVFIDAQHNFVNTRFDIAVWNEKLVSGGVIALHDTDEKRFAGTREAAYRASRGFELFAHIPNLVMFRRA